MIFTVEPINILRLDGHFNVFVLLWVCGSGLLQGTEIDRVREFPLHACGDKLSNYLSIP